ncbi:MAG: replicative DNA helicase [Thiobacillus sp.]
MNAMTDLKLPPHHTESEQSVIGILLSHPERFDDLAELLTHTDFYHWHHQALYAKITEMVNTGVSVDVVTVAERLGDEQLEQIGGLPMLVSLVQSAPSRANLSRYAETIKEKSQLRQLASIFNDGAESCMASQPLPAEEIASAIEMDLMKVSDVTTTEPKELSKILTEAIAYIESRDTVSGLQTGFIDLDRSTGGLEPADLVILAARPSMGKTALAVNIADNVAKSGKSVMMFSLEMPSQQIGLRILSARSRIPISAMRGGESKLPQDSYDKMGAAMASVSSQKFVIDDRPAVSVAYIRAKARKIKRKHGLDLIVIDYLQLMTGKGDNRVQEIGSISRGLKAVAKELEVPIIALAQLNRGLESRSDKRPVLSDLRDSGEIEQDADIVLMLYRDEYYNEKSEYQGLAECLIRKQRNGALGMVKMVYQGDIVRFDSFGGNWPEPRQPESARSGGRKGFEYA